MTASLSVLLVEDEPLIAMMLEDFIETLGHNIAGSCDSVVAALQRIEGGGIDLAILDVQVRDGPSWRVADMLADRGIRFVVATGGHVEPPPERHRGVPTLTKPFSLASIEAVLTEPVS